MFLMRKTLSTPAKEGGSSLLAVIGFMGVAAVVTLAIVGSTMNSLGMSSGTRAAVQSQAAAAGGIDDALVKLTKDDCKAGEWDVPNLKARVRVSASANASGDSWTVGCPTSSAVRVKIIATGTATDRGLAGNDTGDTAKIESIYAWQAQSTSTPGAQSTVLYSYSLGSFAGSSQINAPDGELPFLMVRNKNVSCLALPTAETAIFEASVVISNGGLDANGSCQIKGSVWSSDPIFTHESAQIFGNVVAPSARLIESSIVHGSVWTSGATELETSAWIKGSVTAGSLSMINSAKIDQNAWSAGETTIGHTTNVITGQLTTKSLVNKGPGTITGGTTIVPSGPGPGTPPPAAPTVPDWADVSYDPANWPGYSEVKMSSGCGYAEVLAAVNGFTGAGIIDARACPTGVTLKGSLVMDLPHDLVIYANSFHIGESAQITAAAGSERSLWLITPDEIADNEPTCLANGDTTITESFIVKASVSAMVYSPCSILMSSPGHLVSAQWSGQFYGGSVDAGGSSMLNYSPVVFPGTALAKGSIPGSGTTTVGLGSRISIRDLNG